MPKLCTNLWDIPYVYLREGKQMRSINWNKQQPPIPLQWRHNGRNGVSNHQPRDSLLNCLFRPRSKKTSKAPRHWHFLGGIRRWPVNCPHKGPVTRKMFPFDGIMPLRTIVSNSELMKNAIPSWKTTNYITKRFGSFIHIVVLVGKKLHSNRAGMRNI